MACDSLGLRNYCRGNAAADINGLRTMKMGRKTPALSDDDQFSSGSFAPRDPVEIDSAGQALALLVGHVPYYFRIEILSVERAHQFSGDRVDADLSAVG